MDKKMDKTDKITKKEENYYLENKKISQILDLRKELRSLGKQNFEVITEKEYRIKRKIREVLEA